MPTPAPRSPLPRQPTTLRSTSSSEPPALALLVALFVLVISLRVPGHAASPSEDAAAAAFFEGPILTWHIHLSTNAVAALRQQPRSYQPATIRVGDAEIHDIGVHIKGAVGSRRTIDDRPSLTLKFNHFRRGQRAFGMQKLHLNNCVQDASTLNEILASRLYRRLGLPAARATHALVRVNGRDLGVYVVTEGFDNDYLRRQFPGHESKPGNLYEGAFVGDIDRPLKRDAGRGPRDGSDLARLRDALRHSGPERWNRLASALDLDRFATFTALQLILDDRDGYVRNRNNYRIYFRGSDGRAVFIPHGMDQLLQHADGPIRDVLAGAVANAAFAPAAQKLRLRDLIRELTASSVTEPILTRDVDELCSRLESALRLADLSQARDVGAIRSDVLSRIRQRLAGVQRELLEWKDPLVPWPKGHSIQPAHWSRVVQTGSATTRVEAARTSTHGILHFTCEAAETRASYRSPLTLPAGSYRIHGRCKTSGLVSYEDPFGAGAALRITGSAAATTGRIDGTREWTDLHFDFEFPDDGSVELILEIRAHSGEAWFDLDAVRVDAR